MRRPWIVDLDAVLEVTAPLSVAFAAGLKRDKSNCIVTLGLFDHDNRIWDTRLDSPCDPCRVHSYSLGSLNEVGAKINL